MQIPSDWLGLLALVLGGLGVFGRLIYGTITTFLAGVAGTIGDGAKELAASVKDVGHVLADIRRDIGVNHSDTQRTIERARADGTEDMRSIVLESERRLLHELRNVRIEIRERIPHPSDSAAVDLLTQTSGATTLPSEKPQR